MAVQFHNGLCFTTKPNMMGVPQVSVIGGHCCFTYDTNGFK